MAQALFDQFDGRMRQAQIDVKDLDRMVGRLQAAGQRLSSRLATLRQGAEAQGGAASSDLSDRVIEGDVVPGNLFADDVAGMAIFERHVDIAAGMGRIDLYGGSVQRRALQML